MVNIQVNTPFGKVIGRREGGVRIFRGIVYARYERFAPPVAADVSGADREIQALDYGTLCPQVSSRLDALLGKVEGLRIAEGELCLSIYAPEDESVAHPVMLWIHGGSFLSGGSEDPRYGAERLVRTGGVVVVKVSYRLGAEGWLYWPQAANRNLGLKDLHCALGWVHRNIRFFGGDPANVMLFSQSAGAHAAASLIATSADAEYTGYAGLTDSAGAPLFRRAILQSAPLGITITPSEAEKVREAFLRALGKSVSSASMADILAAQEKVKNMRSSLTFMPVLEDNMLCPECCRGLQIFATCAAQDASPYALPPFDKLFSRWPSFERRVSSPVVKLLTHKIFMDGMNTYISRLNSLGVQARSHIIRWCPRGSVMGACHCIELPFILGDYDDWKDARMLQGMTRSDYDHISAELLSAWTSFARSGSWPELTI
jgi:para-nitrobenzyl esterase